MDLLALLALVMLASGGRSPAWPSPAPVAKPPAAGPVPAPATAAEPAAPDAPSPAADANTDDRGNVWADTIARDAANDAWRRIAPSQAVARLQAAHKVARPDGKYGRKTAARLATHLVRGSVPPWYVKTKGDKTPMPPPAPPVPAKEPIAASGDSDEPV